MNKALRICSAVKRHLTPTPKRRSIVEATAEQLRKTVERECWKAKLTAEVRLEGSVAKNTWIQDHVDVDIFIRVSPELTKRQLEELILPIAKRALTGHRIIERYADHPYVESYIPLPHGDLRVNIVPCYNVERGSWHSATDRTPYHTEYIRENLTAEQADEVRLLKAFLIGIGSYGADIRTGGFSGMLAETLILAYGEFLKVIDDFIGWRENRFIDIEHHYENRRDEIPLLFKEPLVVIDPVDKGRNLAAAVQSEQLWNFVAASRYFLAKPSKKLFQEPDVTPLKAREYRNLMGTRRSTLICLTIGKVGIVVDDLWSQLCKTERALTNLLRNNDFDVIRSSSWTDEKSLNLILFELETGQLPVSRLHNGPPVSRAAESVSFLTKHSDEKNTVSGPWVQEERWVVQKRRTVTSATNLLKTRLKSGGTDVGVANKLSVGVRRGFQLCEEDRIARLISNNNEFAKYMRQYLSGRPVWYA